MKRRASRLGFAINAALSCLTLEVGSVPAFAAIPSPAAQQQQRGDVRDLSPLPQNTRGNYPENELSNDGIFAPAPEAPRVNTLSKKKSSTLGPGAKPSTTANVTTQVTSGKSEWERAIDRLDIYYTAFFNGPSLDGAPETTWNRWSNSAAAFYIYHAFDVDYHFDRTNLVGFEISAKQNLVARASPYGGIEEPSTQFNDPQFWYKRSGMISNPVVSLDSRFSIWPAVTTFETIELAQIASAAWDTTWNFKFLDRSWSSYFTTRVRPTFFTDIYAADGYTREWMYLSAGYYVGYSFSQSWQVNFSAGFDCSFYAQNDQFWTRSDSSADFGQLELNYNIGRLARIGAYVQAGIIEPSMSKATAGLDVTVNFL